MRFLVLALLLLIWLPTLGTADSRMNVTVDEVEMGLGEKRTATLILDNPLDRPDIYDIGVSAAMDQGAVAVQIVGDNRTADRVEVALGAGERRAVQVHFTASACPSTTCTGTAPFIGRSLETDERFTASTRVTIQRNKEIYGSPGIAAPQIIVLALLGAFSALYRL